MENEAEKVLLESNQDSILSATYPFMHSKGEGNYIR